MAAEPQRDGDNGAVRTPRARAAPARPVGAVRSWHVYLLECADGSLYCGVTNDLTRRLAQHNGQRVGGARYTRSRRPVRLLACAPCPDRPCALRLEYRLRRLPRRQKLQALRALHTPAQVCALPGSTV